MSRWISGALLIALSGAGAGCQTRLDGRESEREQRAFLSLHEAIAVLEEGRDPEGIETRIAEAERAGLPGACESWFKAQIDGAREALALLCESNPLWRQRTEELRAEVHTSPCHSAQANDPSHPFRARGANRSD